MMNNKYQIMNCFGRILPMIALLTGIGTSAYVVLNKEKIKTKLRLREKIQVDSDLELSKDFVAKPLESKLSKLLRNPGIQGVHVLYEPHGSGKTTAIKRVLRDIQDENVSETMIVYDWNNNNIRKKRKFNIRPMYIDLRKNSLNWAEELGGEKFTDTISDNMHLVIVLDHMSDNVIHGFDDNNSMARNLFSYYATQSYNTGYKFVVIIVTNNREYAKKILQCNGCQKVHQVLTDHDINGKLQTEAIIGSLNQLNSCEMTV